MTEDEFENSEISPHPAKSAAVAIDNKHAYKKVVIKPSKEDPSPSNRVSRDTQSNVISTSGSLKNVDKINNLVQKETALGRVGVTREKAYRVIATALDAKKWTDVVDEQGNVRREYVDDLEKQRWGAEMAIKMFGDMIERKEIEHDLGDRTLDRLRALSVSELKARAADILLGKRVVVTDAEVIK